MSDRGSDFYIRFVTDQDKDKPVIQGECLDELHPGNPDVPHPITLDAYGTIQVGWFQFTSLSFNYEVAESELETEAEKTKRLKEEQKKMESLPTLAAKRKYQKELDEKKDRDRKITFSKTVDKATTVMWKSFCYSGRPIKKVEVEACRPGGIPGAPKIPYVRLVFEGDIHIKEVKMDLQDDALPSERITFTYKKARVESIWTDNETGERCVSKPQHFGWDFDQHKEWTE